MVCIRGLNVTRGYKNNHEANKTSFLFGLLHTSDVGFFDSNGYCILQVDAVLLAHPHLPQAVSFGVHDEEYAEEINCAVIPKEGVSLKEEKVLQFCKKNLASFKVSKKVFIIDSVLKTATGKIQRRIVAEHFLAQISAAKVPKFGA
ncbi:Detected protein of confused Function [Hibiscus syriacus]|uniref:Detected protein of confused Function n=1 Tax=Hibiscus syriacus TaxID=106335 RepID=A0A6A2XKZ7_HIBSY|nr:Detected protein of confused Function [Hibiscus syriacus]